MQGNAVDAVYAVDAVDVVEWGPTQQFESWSECSGHGQWMQQWVDTHNDGVEPNAVDAQ